MEMYLAQMVIFRIIEKFHLLYIFGTGWISFLFVCILEIVFLVVFIEGYRLVIVNGMNGWKRKITETDKKIHE